MNEKRSKIDRVEENEGHVEEKNDHVEVENDDRVREKNEVESSEESSGSDDGSYDYLKDDVNDFDFGQNCRSAYDGESDDDETMRNMVSKKFLTLCKKCAYLHITLSEHPLLSKTSTHL
ncbi:hypothetical protein TNCT_467651 [Trichonephila clavata]|uniref:Uncharacterized protein n=1 Tax=Trichonephila clavata TaxID=2740835 RepID=A0A8X6H046_TRICU|nr:hypothetical protein TNCT_467651 [Trichonephila clavata]